MKTKINVNGDVHIPVIMRKNLGINTNSEVNIECTKDKITITNLNKMRSQDEIRGFLADLQNYNDEFAKGMKQMAQWVLCESDITNDECIINLTKH